MFMFMKPGADFSRGCALPMIVRTFLLTHPPYNSRIASRERQSRQT